MQIEKRGGKISSTYRMEQTIRFQLKGEDSKGWYSKIIRDFNFETNSLVFQDGEVPLKEIAFIQSDKKGFFGRFVPGFLMFSGVNSILGSLTVWVINDFEFPRVAIISGVASSVVGFILRLITKKKVYTINDSQILRLIDLNLY